MPIGGHDWLLGWLRLAGAEAFVVVAVVHVWHLGRVSTRARVWHLAHVVMALGMMNMFAPAGVMAVPVLPRWVERDEAVSA